MKLSETRRWLLAVPLALATSMAWSAEPEIERWSRQQAAAAAHSPAAPPLREELSAYLRAGEDAAALALIRELPGHAGLSAPARESLVLGFVHSLRVEAPGSVDQVLIDYLLDYPESVMVEHHDHPEHLEPLYGIRSAMAGVTHHWTRHQAALEGGTLLREKPERLASAFMAASDPARRRGLIDAVDTASARQLSAVIASAMEQLDHAADLAHLAGHAAVAARDAASVAQLVTVATGPAINETLRLAAARFDASQQAQVLSAALSSGRAENAALAIAHLAPGSLLDIRPALVTQLADPELGSAAALALARHPSAELRGTLSTIAEREVGLASHRARLALNLMQTLPEVEAPR